MCGHGQSNLSKKDAYMRKNISTTMLYSNSCYYVTGEKQLFMLLPILQPLQYVINYWCESHREIKPASQKEILLRAYFNVMQMHASLFSIYISTFYNCKEITPKNDMEELPLNWWVFGKKVLGYLGFRHASILVSAVFLWKDFCLILLPTSTSLHSWIQIHSR